MPRVAQDGVCNVPDDRLDSAQTDHVAQACVLNHLSNQLLCPVLDGPGPLHFFCKGGPHRQYAVAARHLRHFCFERGNRLLQGWRIGGIEPFFRIDIDFIKASRSDFFDLFLGSNQIVVAIQWMIQPRAIQVVDEHSHLELGYMNMFDHGKPPYQSMNIGDGCSAGMPRLIG